VKKPTQKEISQGIERPPACALYKGVPRRAAIIAFVIGSILTAANQWAALFGNQSIQYLPLILVYVTPFVVVTVSQVVAIRAAFLDVLIANNIGFQRERLVLTLIRHGIPLRALSLGLTVGTLNTAIVTTVILSNGGSVSDLPVTLLAQSYVLPVLFGLVSQSISYRRAITTISAMCQAAPGI